MEQPQLQRQDPDAKQQNVEVEGMTEMSLREHLLAAQAATASQAQLHHGQYRPDSSSPQSHLGNDIAPAPYDSADVSMGGHLMALDVDHKGKRELSTSKRAAQNRAAQRAFRQRKEGYIKKLEDQVRNFNALQQSYKAIEHENYQLRDYVLALQTRLADSSIEVPPSPASIDLHNPRPPLRDDLSELQTHLADATSAAASAGDVPTAPMGSSAASQLARAAVQAGEYVAADLERRQNEESNQPYPLAANLERPRDPPREDLADTATKSTTDLNTELSKQDDSRAHLKTEGR